jgi:hypothetical protein
LATHGYAVTADAERRRREMDCMLKKLRSLNEESCDAPEALRGRIERLMIPLQ